MNTELYHFGIKGQKWGVRRFQNEDGSLTKEGIKRYGINKNGWMTEEGRKQYLDDINSGHREIEERHLSKFKNMSYAEIENNEEYDKAYNEMIKDRRSYVNSMGTGTRKRENEQTRIKLRYKDYTDAQKVYKKDGINTVIAMNKKGKMDLYMTDENGNVKGKMSNGYNIVKSMDDIMNSIDLYELTKTNK